MSDLSQEKRLADLPQEILKWMRKPAENSGYLYFTE